MIITYFTQKKKKNILFYNDYYLQTQTIPIFKHTTNFSHTPRTFHLHFHLYTCLFCYYYSLSRYTNNHIISGHHHSRTSARTFPLFKQVGEQDQHSFKCSKLYEGHCQRTQSTHLYTETHQAAVVTNKNTSYHTIRKRTLSSTNIHATAVPH